MAKKLLKYGVALAVGAVIALAVALSRGAFSQADTLETARHLSDAFFTSAVALGSVGLLAFVASDGFFDMLAYGARKALSVLKREMRSDTFYDYKMMKAARRGGGYGFLLAVAALYLALATAFMLLCETA